MQIGSKFTIGVHVITAIDYFKEMDRVNSEFLPGASVSIRSSSAMSFHNCGKPDLSRRSAGAAVRNW